MLKEKILLLSPAFALAFLVAASGVSSQAFAGNELTHVYWILDDKDGDGIGDTEVEKDELGNFYMTFYDEDGNVEFTIKLSSSNPDPDGGDPGHVDFKSLLDEAMKNGGAAWEKVNTFLQSTLGQTLLKHNKTGSIVPYHNPVTDSSMPGDGYGGGTGGGFVPNSGMSIVDQLKKGKKKGKGSGGGGSKKPKAPGYDFSADPALVNPVPINLPVAKPSKTKVHNLPAPALTQKGKGPIGNLTKYPDIPNLPSPTAATNQNRGSGFNPAVGMQPGAAVGNFQTMQGGGGSRGGVSHR